MSFMFRRFFRSPQFMASLALILALGFVSSFYLRNQIQNARLETAQLGERWIPGIAQIGDLQANVLRFRNWQYAYAYETGQAKRQLERLLDEETKGISVQRDMIKSKLTNDEEKKLYDAVSSSWDEYAKIHDRFTMTVKAGNREVAMTILSQDGTPVFRRLESAILGLGSETYSGTSASHFGADRSFGRVQRFAEFLMIANLALGLLFGFTAYRRFRAQKSRPARRPGSGTDGGDSGDKVVPFKKAA